MKRQERIVFPARVRSLTAGFFLPVAFFLAFPSCSKIRQSCTVSLKTEVVEYTSGSVFVSVHASGDWTLSLAFPDSDIQWARLGTVSGSGSRNSVVLSYDANDSGTDRSVEIIAECGGVFSTAVLRQLSASSNEFPEDPDYPDLKSDALRGWMEVPGIPALESGCAWVFHDMTVNGAKMRNYSLYYDVSNRLSRWVAYPLNQGLRGSGTREDQFGAKDPKIPYKYQPYTEVGWGVGGYDRGHQIPAADRYWEDAHRATFYPTNMTVQNSSFNRGLWEKLEAKVRTWSDKCDTLYVVTGCVPGDGFITDRGGNEVNVPAGYYKALLRYDKSSTLSKYLGIAFYFENKPDQASAVTQDMAITIDQLENRLGIDFFPNLSEAEQKAAESTVSVWWWN